MSDKNENTANGSTEKSAPLMTEEGRFTAGELMLVLQRVQLIELTETETGKRLKSRTQRGIYLNHWRNCDRTGI